MARRTEPVVEPVAEEVPAPDAQAEEVKVETVPERWNGIIVDPTKHVFIESDGGMTLVEFPEGCAVDEGGVCRERAFQFGGRNYEHVWDRTWTDDTGNFNVWVYRHM